MSVEEKSRISGDAPRGKVSPVLPTHNFQEKALSNKRGIPPAVYVV